MYDHPSGPTGPAIAHRRARRISLAFVTLCSVLAVMAFLATSSALASSTDKAQGAVNQFGQKDYKPRTIVTTDPELDDLNSLIRMLLYSNEIRIEGLVYASGQHHYAGDPAAGIPAYRWKAGQSHIEDALDAYDRVDREPAPARRGLPDGRPAPLQVPSRQHQRAQRHLRIDTRLTG